LTYLLFIVTSANFCALSVGYKYNGLFYFLFPLLCDRFEADSEKHSTPVMFHFLKLFCQSD